MWRVSARTVRSAMTSWRMATGDLRSVDSRLPRREKRLRETARQVVELSIQHRVLTPYTAMLVLESETAYDRFGLQRDTLAPILSIDGQGVTLATGRDQLPELDSELDKLVVAESELLEGEVIPEPQPGSEPQPEPQPASHRSRVQVLGWL